MKGWVPSTTVKVATTEIHRTPYVWEAGALFSTLRVLFFTCVGTTISTPRVLDTVLDWTGDGDGVRSGMLSK